MTLEASTKEPIEEATEQPTEEPTEEPSEQPTEEPTEEPAEEPTEEPSEQPEPTEHTGEYGSDGAVVGLGAEETAPSLPPTEFNWRAPTSQAPKLEAPAAALTSQALNNAV